MKDVKQTGGKKTGADQQIIPRDFYMLLRSTDSGPLRNDREHHGFCIWIVRLVG